MGWVVNATPWPLYPHGETPGNPCTEHWEGPKAGLN
jgi:hypothetical protein